MGRRRAQLEKLRRKKRGEYKRKMKLLKQNAPVVGNSDQDAACQAFVQWCLHRGIEFSPNVAITRKRVVHGRGMVATANIKAGEVLFEIPRSAMFSEKTCKHADVLMANLDHGVHSVEEDSADCHEEADACDGACRTTAASNREDGGGDHGGTCCGSHAKEHKPTTDEQTGDIKLSGWSPLLLAMMLDMDAGEASEFAPYFNILPEDDELHHPHVWTDRERSTLLKDSRLQEDVARDLTLMKREYDTIAKPFMIRHPKIFPQPGKKAFSFRKYAQCAAIVMGYSFTDEEDGRVCLVPVADILNHVTGKNNARLFFSDKTLQMRSIKRIPAGAEIFNTYGDLDNLQLVQQHGFAEPSPTPWEEVSLHPRALKAILHLTDDRFAFLKDTVSGLLGEDARLLVGILGDAAMSYPNWLFAALVTLCVCQKDKCEPLREHIEQVHAAQAEADSDEDEAEEEKEEEDEAVEGQVEAARADDGAEKGEEAQEQEGQEVQEQEEQVSKRAKKGADDGNGNDDDDDDDDDDGNMEVDEDDDDDDGDDQHEGKTLAEQMEGFEYGGIELTEATQIALHRVMKHQSELYARRAEEVKAAGECVRKRRKLAAAVFEAGQAVCASWLARLGASDGGDAEKS
ncbi:hypothetical protein PTSG_01368 [Salpingoeca rosetta]|uniref:SET domain-containing protein n=1 Tax=Salpingoeca rosetta (strain ATCC 50818 / BSB-021) TaxID=946362 RepID=F2U051_SALR5|nr:uncharacterized protein PTSG_01368 [Salpingoeca rosetta]EGD80779.1 hypothetical protein PTSG_01368 [Salpingoeca rosetta]|eukprot:XP_004997340.1 hypothetical protein PTSG_01368 [Salpingoeca rosetta]